MKSVLLILTILLCFMACEKSTISPDASKPNTNFSTQILPGYFVTSIAFDLDGNAWIGTFKQGLIKYSSKGPKLYNAENTGIPDSAVIHDIAVDSKNNVWIGTGGLLKYDGVNFTLYIG